jgi:hypothetical protein
LLQGHFISPNFLEIINLYFLQILIKKNYKITFL